MRGHRAAGRDRLWCAQGPFSSSPLASRFCSMNPAATVVPGAQRPACTVAGAAPAPTSTPPARPLFRHVRYENLVAGMSGGVISTLVLHPLDLVKIRFAGETLRATRQRPRPPARLALPLGSAPSSTRAVRCCLPAPAPRQRTQKVPGSAPSASGPDRAMSGNTPGEPRLPLY